MVHPTIVWHVLQDNARIGQRAIGHSGQLKVSVHTGKQKTALGGRPFGGIDTHDFSRFGRLVADFFRYLGEKLRGLMASRSANFDTLRSQPEHLRPVGSGHATAVVFLHLAIQDFDEQPVFEPHLDTFKRSPVAEAFRPALGSSAFQGL